jgi:hypothetical protein
MMGCWSSKKGKGKEKGPKNNACDHIITMMMMMMMMLLLLLLLLLSFSRVENSNNIIEVISACAKKQIWH